ncbi:MAG TPA: hypothetical protein VI357_18775 [Mycobacteriales bacterium]
MRFLKTFAVAAGAAAVLGGAGIGVAQAGSASPTVATSSTSHEAGHEAGHEARHTGTDDRTSARHEAEARGRVAEGETHARHTGADDPATHDLDDDNGSGGHGADD